MVASNTENASDLLSEGHHSKTDQYTLRTDTLLRKPSSVDTTQESQSFRTPAWDRESPPTVTYPPGLLKLAVPRSAISSPRDFNPNLYTEASNTPKRFRPEEYEKESPGDDELTDSTMSSSRAWLPPEPPDEVPEGEETPISPTEFSRSANEYTGAVLQPGQLSSITTYGFPGGAFTPHKKRTITAYRNASESSPSHSKLHRRPSTTVTSDEEALGLEGFRHSPETSSAGTRTNSGAPLTQSDRASSTFAIRAKEAGIADWNEKVTKGLTGNNSVFDGRWVLNPDEAWNVPARGTSVMTGSPDGQSTDYASNGGAALSSVAFPVTEGHKWDIRSNEGLLEAGAPHIIRAYAKELSESVGGHDYIDQGHSHEADLQDDENERNDATELEGQWRRSLRMGNVPEAKESLRLEQYVTDLSLANGGLQSKLESYDPTSISRVFYLRVFDNADPQAPHGEDAEKLVKYKGRVVTYRELYFNLIGEINDLVAYMTAPMGAKTLQKLAIKRDEVTARQLETMKPIERYSTRDVAHSANGLSKPHGSDYQLRNIAQHQSFDQQKPEEAPCAEVSQFDEQVDDMIEPPRSESTRNISTLANPSACNIAVGNAVSATSILFRSPPGFGDPATADFKPVTAFDNVEDFSPEHRSALSIRSIHSQVESDAPFSRAGPPSHENTFSAYQRADAESDINFPELARSNNSNASIAQRPNRGHPFAVAATNAPSEDAVAAGMAQAYSTLQIYKGQGVQRQRPRAHAPLIDRPSHQLYGLSPDSGLQGHSLNIPTHASHSQAFPQCHTQQQTLPLLQAQYRTQPGAPQTQHHADFLRQSHGRYDQISPSNAHAFSYNVHGQQIDSQGLTYHAQLHPSVGFPQTPASRGHALTDEDQNILNQMGVGPYQHWLGQNFPLYPSHQQRPFADVHGSGSFTDATAGQPYKCAPGSGFPTYSQHGAAPSLTAQTYSQPYIPADKYARAPAPNRIASRFAQISGFQSIQPKMPMSASAVQTRYPTPVHSPRTNLAALSYRAGSDNMFPTQIPGVASVRYQDLTRDEPPRFAVAGDENYIPFVENTKLSKPAEWGVLKVSNMPYDITRELILAFLGTHAKTITPDLGPCIHIMMDRATGKTQDCYIEFFSVPDARAWHTVITRRGPHLNKIADRILEVELSSQEELLKELFPRARCVVWNGAHGVQVKETEEAFDSGFKGFITQEELKGLIHHAEQPHRSLYTQKCPTRPYTNLISILAKFPWHATQHYTLSTRNALYAATLTLIKTLASFLRRSSSSFSTLNQNHHLPSHHHSNPSHDSNTSANIVNLFRPDLSATELARLDMREKGLNESLLKELVLAGLNAHGFSDRQRWELYLAAACVLGRQWMRLSPLTGRWPFEAVGRKAAWEEDVVEFYAHLLSTHPSLSLARRSPDDNSTNNMTPRNDIHYSQQQQQQQQQQHMGGSIHHTTMPFGRFDAQLYETSLEGYREQTVTMAALGKWEMGVIRSVIRALCV